MRNSTVLAIEYRGKMTRMNRNSTYHMEKNDKIVKIKEKLLEVADLKVVMEGRAWAVYEVTPLIEDTDIISHAWFAEEVVNFATAMSKQKETFIIEYQFFHYERTPYGLEEQKLRD